VPLLAVDAGNTQTVLGLFGGAKLVEHWRLTTEPSRTGDELGVLWRTLLDVESLDGVCLGSSVPQLVHAYDQLVNRIHKRILVVGPGTRTGLRIGYDDPREVAPDRVANAVSAKERHGTPSIVVDFGTSTNFDIVSADGSFVGGVLAPGVETSMDALFARAARLFKVDFVEPATVIGTTTASALQSGLVYGFAGQVDAIVDRICGELGADAPAIATGGLAELIVPHTRTIEKIDPFLTLEGLRLIWELNQ